MKLQRASFSLSGSGGFGSSQKGDLWARSAPRGYSFPSRGYSFPSKVADRRKFSRGGRRRRPEAQLHAAVVEHLRLRAKPDVLWLHCPNGERRDKITGAKLKRMGVLAGASDLLLWHQGNSFALELKAPGGRLSEAQLEFLARFNDAGGHTAIAEGLDRALACLEGWGLLVGRTQ
jgi:VRR-NUC domain